MELQEKPRGLGRGRLIGGVLLIFFGVMALVENYVDLMPLWWVVALVGAGLVTLIIFLTDRSQWGLLIPTYVLWAIAGIIAIAEWEIILDDFIATFVLTAIALPFLVVFLRDRSKWWALIPAYVMLAIAIMIPLDEYGVLADEFIATFVLTAIALPFLVVFLLDRSKWWALIPAYIMLTIAIMVPLIENHILGDAFIATYVLTVIALPFILVFVLDTERWWALIPAYALIIIGVMVWLIDDGVLINLNIPAYILIAIAIPFFLAFARNPKERWPLIPGIIIAGIGLTFLMAGAMSQYIVPAILIISGGGLLIAQFTRRKPASLDEPLTDAEQRETPPSV